MHKLFRSKKVTLKKFEKVGTLMLLVIFRGVYADRRSLPLVRKLNLSMMQKRLPGTVTLSDIIDNIDSSGQVTTKDTI